VVAVAALLSQSSCVSSRPAASSASSFPPDRALWQSASAETRAEHARVLHEALETPQEGQPHAWSAAGGSGSVTVNASFLAEEVLLCRRFTDSITSGDSSKTVQDLACWLTDDWYYFRQEPNQPVLGPAQAQADPA
jgi:hypothetical protein